MAVIIFIFAAIVLIDVYPLFRRKKKNHAWVVVLLCLIPAMVLAILRISNITVPSLVMMLGDALKKIGLFYPM